MNKSILVAKNLRTMGTVADLTRAFEGISSMRISNIKDGVLRSQKFFEELWGIYTQLRVGNSFRYGRATSSSKIIDKELFIAVTGEAGLSGNIDQKLIAWMLKEFDPLRHEIIVIGHHGAVQLVQAGVHFNRYFKMPAGDSDINATPLIKEVIKYRETSVFYQTYSTLRVQNVKRLSLGAAVAQTGTKSTHEKIETISEENYIFEPNALAVADHLERSMLHIMLSQAILDSKLAQYASQFNAMSIARERSDKEYENLKTTFNRAKRAEKDERLKEMVNGISKASKS